MVLISDLRALEQLAEEGPTIWETHSLFNDKGANYIVKYEEVAEDLQKCFGFSDKLIALMKNQDMIHIRDDYQGVWITWYKGDTDAVDNIASQIEPILLAAAETNA